MAIYSIDEEGNLVWHCPHVAEEADGPCKTRHEHHISHEHIQWSGSMDGHHMVSLPPCSGCGVQTFLKVHFSEKELKAPNMWLEWNGFWEERLQQAEQEYKAEQGGAVHLQMLAQQIQQLRTAKEAGGVHTDSHAMAMRHQELASQLKASGKVPNIQKEQIDNG